MPSLNPSLIDPNPWQPRHTIDPEALGELAEDIKQNGLLQPPAVRQVGARYQLVFGHRRLAAWQIAFPGRDISVEIRTLTDPEMAVAAIRENEDRVNLNPIDRARGMKRMIDEFHYSQLDAGKLYGLKSQSAVSNLLGLLQLPQEVQSLLIAGQLAERHARALLPLSRIDPKEAKAIAVEAVKEEAGERDVYITEEINSFVHRKGKYIQHWELSWESKAPTVCAACPKQCRQFCFDSKCYKSKLVLFAEAEAERVSQKLHLPSINGNKGTRIDLSYKNCDEWREMLKHKDAGKYLFVGPSVSIADGYYNGFQKDVLGSYFVCLYTAPSFTPSTLRVAEKKPKPSKPLDKRIEKAKLEEKKRKERSQQCKIICADAAPLFSNIFPENDFFLGLIANGLAGFSGQGGYAGMEQFKKTAVAERRKLLAEWFLRSEVPHDLYDEKATPANAIKKIEQLAETLKVKLPKAWHNGHGST